LHLIHKAALVHRQVSETRTSIKRDRTVLYADAQRVVLDINGSIEVHHATQEKYSYTIKEAPHGVVEADLLAPAPHTPVQPFAELLRAGVVQQALCTDRILIRSVTRSLSGGCAMFRHVSP
jgi:hypothetical protein